MEGRNFKAQGENGASPSTSSPPLPSSSSASISASGGCQEHVELSYTSAGVLPFSFDEKGQLMFLLGQEKFWGGKRAVSQLSSHQKENTTSAVHSGDNDPRCPKDIDRRKLEDAAKIREEDKKQGSQRLIFCPFGGHKEDGDLDEAHTAAREFAEETLGLFESIAISDESISNCTKRMADQLRLFQRHYPPAEKNSSPSFSSGTPLSSPSPCSSSSPPETKDWSKVVYRTEYRGYVLFLCHVPFMDAFMLKLGRDTAFANYERQLMLSSDPAPSSYSWRSLSEKLDFVWVPVAQLCSPIRVAYHNNCNSSSPCRQQLWQTDPFLHLPAHVHSSYSGSAMTLTTIEAVKNAIQLRKNNRNRKRKRRRRNKATHSKRSKSGHPENDSSRTDFRLNDQCGHSLLSPINSRNSSTISNSLCLHNTDEALVSQDSESTSLSSTTVTIASNHKLSESVLSTDMCSSSTSSLLSSCSSSSTPTQIPSLLSPIEPSITCGTVTTIVRLPNGRHLRLLRLFAESLVVNDFVGLTEQIQALATTLNPPSKATRKSQQKTWFDSFW